MASFDNFSFLDQINTTVDTYSINFTKKNEEHTTESLTQNIEKFNFEFAAVNDPSTFCDSIKQSDGAERKIMDFHKGTTTLGNYINFL